MQKGEVSHDTQKRPVLLQVRWPQVWQPSLALCATNWRKGSARRMSQSQDIMCAIHATLCICLNMRDCGLEKDVNKNTNKCQPFSISNKHVPVETCHPLSSTTRAKPFQASNRTRRQPEICACETCQSLISSNTGPSDKVFSHCYII